MTFSVVSTFSGCGGSSLGYQMAGGKVLLAVEWDDNAVATYRLNFPKTDVYHGDISKLTIDEILERTQLKIGQLDIFDGSPPCQGFSSAGKRSFEDNRNQLFKEYVRILAGLKPKVFVMENVSGMVKGNMKLMFADILKTLKNAGYKVKAALLDASFYGVPQSRQRMIFIGIREDLGIDPTHPLGTTRQITVREAFKDCPDIEDRPMPQWLKDAGKLVPANKTDYDSVARAFKATKGTTGSAMGTKFLKWDAPACTICKSEIAASGVIHPNRHRYINVHELKRLGGFPDSFQFIDRKSAVMRIGNSVPPPLMKKIAEHISTTILSRVV
jgi:DNA (cytosine-5)-methyltransferase 1